MFDEPYGKGGLWGLSVQPDTKFFGGAIGVNIGSDDGDMSFGVQVAYAGEKTFSVTLLSGCKGTFNVLLEPFWGWERLIGVGRELELVYDRHATNEDKRWALRLPQQ